ncbi:hypothetical protein AMTR_s00097p00110700 [Amborella trichopoda]|uniref:Uncharacterized protein n=1 Tax=Amborella trichopoda TaxID=13333 RepID=W1P1F0_AMBTC|nr:hypothetical protein AMTR_s00097p00110700 [Amborella trichopoda]
MEKAEVAGYKVGGEEWHARGDSRVVGRVTTRNEVERGQQSGRNRLQLREGKLAERGYKEEEGEGSKGGPTAEEEEAKMGRLAAATRWLRLIVRL